MVRMVLRLLRVVSDDGWVRMLVWSLDDRMTDRWTVICNCRVAFAAENRI